MVNKSAFVGEKNFDVIKMNCATIKKIGLKFPFLQYKHNLSALTVI